MHVENAYLAVMSFSAASSFGKNSIQIQNTRSCPVLTEIIEKLILTFGGNIDNPTYHKFILIWKKSFQTDVHM